MDIRKQIYRFIDMYVDTPEPKKLCSSIQDLVEELAEYKVKNIEVIRCSTQLRRESKSFTDLKTIADIQRLYPNQESYGVSVSDGLQKFYVNNEVIYTKALIV